VQDKPQTYVWISHVTHMCHMTYPCDTYVSHDLSMCKTELIPMCDMTRPSTLTPLDRTHLFAGQIDKKYRNVSDTECATVVEFLLLGVDRFFCEGFHKKKSVKV